MARYNSMIIAAMHQNDDHAKVQPYPLISGFARFQRIYHRKQPGNLVENGEKNSGQKSDEKTQISYRQIVQICISTTNRVLCNLTTVLSFFD